MKTMKTTPFAPFAVAVVVALGLGLGCASGGPTQADGPKPNLDDNTASGKNPASGSKDLDDAMAALEAKDCKSATEKAQKVLSTAPQTADAHFVLAVCFEADKKNDDAVKEYRAALAIDAGASGASINLCALLVDLKRWDEAVEVAKAGLAKQKGAVELHINLAYALKGKGDHATAVKAFANAVALKPDDAGLRLDHGLELLATGDKDGAAKELKNAIAKANGDAVILAEAGVGLAQCDDAPGCVAALDKAVAVSSTAELLTERAICKHKAKDLAGARKDLDDALAKDAGSLKAHAAAAKYAEEAKDKKACKLHYAEVAKLAQGELAEQAKKGVERCSK